MKYRVISVIYVFTGIVLTIHAAFFLGKPNVDSFSILNNGASPVVEKITRLEIEITRNAYIEEKKAEIRDPASLGHAAFTMGRYTGDVKWANSALNHLQEIEPAARKTVEIAYLGASHTIFARDYPYKGLWQIFTGPGFARIYHVMKGKSLLMGAVESNIEDPVVRLIRANSFANLPKIFGGHDIAEEDFSFLRNAILSKDDTESELLSSSTFQTEVLKADALRLEKLGNDVAAAQAWQEIMSIAPETSASVIARSKLEL